MVSIHHYPIVYLYLLQDDLRLLPAARLLLLGPVVQDKPVRHPEVETENRFSSLRVSTQNNDFSYGYCKVL